MPHVFNEYNGMVMYNALDVKISAQEDHDNAVSATFPLFNRELMVTGPIFMALLHKVSSRFGRRVFKFAGNLKNK